MKRPETSIRKYSQPLEIDNEQPCATTPTSLEMEGGDVDKDNHSDIDNIDFTNFKGIYIDEDPNRKFQDPDTGCHFEYYDLCKRLAKLK